MTDFSTGTVHGGAISIKVDTRINLLLFSKREIKAAMKMGGKVVQKEARRLISSRAVSAPGGLPGYDTGAMSKSIKVTTGSGGGYVKVMPYKTPAMGKDYYPAYLVYGTKRGLKKRQDFMQVAFQSKQWMIRQAIRAAFLRSLRAAPVGKY
jgi:hypothetical protein